MTTPSLDLRGRTALVTGGNSGNGLHTAQALADAGARVVVAARDLDSSRAVAEHLGSGAHALHLDLSSMSSVRSFADGWDGPLHLLVNNAGVAGTPHRSLTADGVERQFAVNYLGHFALTGLLLPVLRESGARIVTVCSLAHHGGTREGVLDGANGEPYGPQRAYKNSKLALALFFHRLHEQITARGLPMTATMAHPGVAFTSIATNRDGMGASWAFRVIGPVLMRPFLQSAASGAQATIHAATVAPAGSYTGPQRLRETRGPVGPARLSPQATDDALAAELWARAEGLTGVTFDW